MRRRRKIISPPLPAAEEAARHRGLKRLHLHPLRSCLGAVAPFHRQSRKTRGRRSPYRREAQVGHPLGNRRHRKHPWRREGSSEAVHTTTRKVIRRGSAGGQYAPCSRCPPEISEGPPHRRQY